MLKIFNKKSFGIDISNNAIIWVELSKTGRSFSLRQAEILLPDRLLVPSRVLNKSEILAFLENDFKNSLPDDVVLDSVKISLPAGSFYLHNFSIIFDNENEISGLIEKEIKENIPAPFRELLFSHAAYETKALDGRTDLAGSIIAADRGNIENWNEIFSAMGFKHIGFEPRNFALYRALYEKSPMAPVCLIEYGLGATEFSIFNRGLLVYSFMVCIGSVDMAAGSSLQKTAGDHIVSEVKSDFNFLRHKYNIEIGEFIVLGRPDEIFINSLTKQFPLAKVITAMATGRLKNIDIKYLTAAGLALNRFEPASESNAPSIICPDNLENEIGLLLSPVPIFFANLKNKIHRSFYFIAIPVIAVIILSIIVGIIAVKPKDPIPVRLIPNNKIAPAGLVPPVYNKIAKDNISAVSNPISSTTGLSASTGRTFVKTKDPQKSLNIRANPSASAKIVGQINPKEEVLMIEEKSGWIKVKKNEKITGWVNGADAEKIRRL